MEVKNEEKNVGVFGYDNPVYKKDNVLALKQAQEQCISKSKVYSHFYVHIGGVVDVKGEYAFRTYISIFSASNITGVCHNKITTYGTRVFSEADKYKM